MAHTNAWSSSNKPLGTDQISTVDDSIREKLLDIEERMLYDHLWGDSTTTDGYHKKVTLKKQSADPTALSDYGILYTKDVSGVTELFYEDSGGTVKQLTTGGKLNIASDEAVLLTGAQTIAGVKTFSSIPVLPASDPTADNEATRRKFVTDKFDTTTGHDHDGTDSKKIGNSGITGVFGAWQSGFSKDTVYQASTDGFVTAYSDAATEPRYLLVKTDSSNPPTTVRVYDYAAAAGALFRLTVTCPVKKGDYWKVECYLSVTIYWIPLGS